MHKTLGVRDLIKQAAERDAERKVCLICKVEKPITAFHKDSRRPGGLRPYCNACRCAEEAGRRLTVPRPKVRKCKICKQHKPHSEFSGPFACGCNSCMEPAVWNERRLQARHALYRKRQKTQVLLNKDLMTRAKGYTSGKQRRDARKAAAIAYLGGKCQACGRICGRKWPACCFDFHHVYGRKIREISILIRRGGLEQPLIKNEVDKCILLCALCHRKLHDKGVS